MNRTWNEQVRKRNISREIGPAFRYSHRNTVERLEDQFQKAALSSELDLASLKRSPRNQVIRRSPI